MATKEVHRGRLVAVNCTPLHSIALHCNALHCTALHSKALDCWYKGWSHGGGREADRSRAEGAVLCCILRRVHAHVSPIPLISTVTWSRTTLSYPPYPSRWLMTSLRLDAFSWLSPTIMNFPSVSSVSISTLSLLVFCEIWSMFSSSFNASGSLKIWKTIKLDARLSMIWK